MKKKIAILTSSIIINIICLFLIIPQLPKVKYQNKLIIKDEKKECKKSNSKAEIYLYGRVVNEDTEELDLSKDQIDERLINILEGFTNLKKVILTNHDMDIVDQANLVKKFPQIDFEFTIKLDDKIYSHDIEKLDLSYTTKSFEEIKNLIILLPKLKILDLSFSTLSNEECSQIRKDFPNIETNWVVNIGNKWSLRTDATAFSLLIKVIDHNNKLTTKDIENLKYCTKLKALDLGHQAITDISIIGDYLTDLRVLILADNKINDISPIAKLKKLHYLALFLNPINSLSPLKENKELVDLNLANVNKIADVSPILGLPKLERLWINNSGVSIEGLQTLKDAYPKTIITTTGTLSTHGSWRYHPRYTQLVDMFKNNYYGAEFSKYD